MGEGHIKDPLAPMKQSCNAHSTIMKKETSSIVFVGYLCQRPR